MHGRHGINNGALGFRKKLLGIVIDHLTGGSEPDALVGAFQQGKTQVLFQIIHLLHHRGAAK